MVFTSYTLRSWQQFVKADVGHDSSNAGEDQTEDHVVEKWPQKDVTDQCSSWFR